jgi:type VI secretion system protein ImpK
LGGSEQDARRRGYGEDEIVESKFVVVVFLDEAVLKSRNPALAGWEQLQFELYQRSDGGEVFFQKLETLLKRGNTSDAADLLEIYDICLLLGFQGVKDESAVNGLTAETINKILKIRAGLAPRRPPWSLPDEPFPAPRADPWISRLLVAAAIFLLLGIALLVGFKVSLNSGADDIRQDQAQVIR